MVSSSAGPPRVSPWSWDKWDVDLAGLFFHQINLPPAYFRFVTFFDVYMTFVDERKHAHMGRLTLTERGVGRFFFSSFLLFYSVFLRRATSHTMQCWSTVGRRRI